MRSWGVVLLIGSFAVAGAGGYVLFLRKDAPGATAIMRSSDPQVLARGAALYRQHCASCHGVNLQGELNWRKRNADGTLPAPPHNEHGHTWHHADRVLFEYTKEGGRRFARGAFKSAMPGFSVQLSNDEIAQIIAYIKSTWPARIRERQSALTEASK